MGLIKEPLDVDFYVDPRPMTKEDEKAISDYIKADKLKRIKKAGRSTSASIVLPKVERKNKASA
ncbi:MAG: hypothetical protein ACTHMD_13110 [Flavisolibacter sp.]